MKKPVLAVLALSLFATPALAEEHKGPGGHRPGPEHFMQKLDTDKDGKVSKAEWTSKGDAMFSESDANKDGFLTREEMEASHAKKREEWKAKREAWKAKQEAPKAK